MRKKRILITTESLVVGGVETSLISLVKFLNTQNVEIDISVLEGGPFMDELKKLNNVDIIPIKVPKNKLIYRILKNLLCNSLYNKFKKIHTKQYDYAIAYYGINNYCDLYAAASNSKKKYLWCHNNFDRLYKFSKYKPIFKLRNIIMSRKYKYFDNIVAVSESAKEGFNKVFLGNDSKLIVINNLMDCDRLKCQNEKCEIQMNSKNKVMFVGRLAPVKRVDLLIKEFSKVVMSIPDTKLYIVGDGPEKKNLELLCNDLKISDKVVFLGSQKNPFKYMKNADILVSASVMEAYSINSLEALAMQKYFVSANNEGAQDIFYITNKANLNNGIVCDVDKMHYHIIYFLKNKSQFKQSFDISLANKIIEKDLINLFGLK